MLQVDTKTINDSGTKKDKSHSSYESQQKCSLVTNNQKRRETYVEALKENIRNGMKENGEGVLIDLERNTGIRGYVSHVNLVIDCNGEDSSEFGKAKPNFLEIYKDLLLPEQINSLGMFSTPSVLNTETFTSHDASHNSTYPSHNASYNSVRNMCASGDLSLDTCDEEILNILEELQCPAV